MKNQNSIRMSQGLHKLQLLRTFKGDANHFWLIYLDSIIDLVGASVGIIVEKDDDEQIPLKVLATFPNGKNTNELNNLMGIASEAIKKNNGNGTNTLTGSSFNILSLLISGNAKRYIILKIMTIEATELSVATMALNSTSDIPEQYFKEHDTLQVLRQREQLINILDINVLLNTHTKFLSAAMTLCNELATAYKCDRVALGWHKGHYIRLKAMSQTDHFDKKMEIVREIEAAMDETADQHAEIILPQSDDSGFYVRDHEHYMKSSAINAIVSLPIRYRDEIVGVCVLEKNEGDFADPDIRNIRIVLDQVSARLNDLYQSSRWVGVRLLDWVRDKAAIVFGFEHTWVKLGLLFTSLILILSVIVPVRYRVDSPMILKTDDITYLAAPFDSYISSVKSKAGERVRSGEVMLSLDDKNLRLEEAGLHAEYTKSKRERDKSRAESDLASMRIFQSQIDQLISRLDVVQLRLSKAQIKSPFDGIVIEGDQHERIGSPVQQGEILYKVGKIEDISVEVKVSENEIQNITVGSTGQVALASRPEELFNVTVNRIEPSAITDASGNFFQVICSFNDSIPQWFRPGMTGIAKIDSGKKSWFWIISHKSIDFIRIKMWW